jgi:DNA-binding Xre family transcriptional regulator
MGSFNLNLKERIDKLREERGMLLRDLGQMAGVSEKGLHDIFRRNDCKLATLSAICEALDISVCEFICEEEEVAEGRAPGQQKAMSSSLVEYKRRLEWMEREAELLRMIIQAKDELIEELKRKVKPE